MIKQNNFIKDSRFRLGYNVHLQNIYPQNLHSSAYYADFLTLFMSMTQHWLYNLAQGYTYNFFFKTGLYSMKNKSSMTIS